MHPPNAIQKKKHKKHACLQTVAETLVKFQKDWSKTVGGLRGQGTYYLCARVEVKLQQSKLKLQKHMYVIISLTSK